MACTPSFDALSARKLTFGTKIMLDQCKQVAKNNVGSEIVLNEHFAVYSTNTVEPQVIKLGIKTMTEAEKIFSLVPVERQAVIVKVETKIRNVRKVAD